MKTQDAIAALRAYQEARRGQVVSAGTLARRAETCAACPMRKPTAGVSLISGILGNLANKHRVPAELADFACGVCGCSMMLLLPAFDDDLHRDSEAEAAVRPETCWMKKLAI